ncbi:MAG TPA: glycosyltransferase family 39 protein [Candidatus Sulfotelmatobacter sp.]|jgi:4-amino-4-deoxy-L-arabinose transferase-like glycosyltransferase|nr:glycosyltransferase family 39 protein [Candidatus Sulfotelmatobacter sp.]
MFTFAIFIGIYSYLMFVLGIFGILTKIAIIAVTIAWVFIFILFEKKMLNKVYKNTKNIHFNGKEFYKNQLYLFVILFVLQALVNLIGALGPELAFDALWYHLTLPKLYLLQHAIYHIPGGLLYYSDMPKLGEMLYIGALAIGNEILVKVIHFSFGILASIALYKLSRNFFSSFISFVIIVIFYSNLVVDWESTTAYIDLIRTFFEVMALWSFINWVEQHTWKWLLVSALMLGLAITTKVLAIGSLIILCILMAFIFIDSKLHTNYRKKDISLFIMYLLIALLIPLPWFIFSYIHSGNLFYPFFTHSYEINVSSSNPLQFITTIWDIFTHSSDPVSPLYLIFMPLLFITFSKFQRTIKMIVWYCGLSLFIWYFTPQTGGGRFILPYLPAFSLVCGTVLHVFNKNKTKFGKYIYQLLIVVIIFVSLISICYRFVANSKYIPVLIGQESKSQFLNIHLNYSYGDFYDTDNYFAKHIKPTDTVLLYGFHNLYYVDFPFIDSSWVKKRDSFTYVILHRTPLPTNFRHWQLLYVNDKTMVQLYGPPKGTCTETCHY